MESELKKNFNILVLDGGGSKGIYTLGLLNELEKRLGHTLDQKFDLIYGTSTGSIIASLIALGYDIQSIKELYLENIPNIMTAKGKKNKSLALKNLADEIFKDLTFDDFKTDIGIVSLNYDTQNPLIFKSNIKQSHGMKHSFIPGFGCKISDAVQSSCSAYPIFDVKIINTLNQGNINAIDGGFIANNATLYALVDADKAFKVPHNNIRVLSVGTGSFVEKPIKGWMKLFKYFKILKFVERILNSSTNSNVILSKILYPHIKILRLNDTFNEPDYGTNMVETDMNKLETLYKLGRDTYARNESEIESILAD